MPWEKARLHRRAKDFIINESGAIALVMVLALVAIMAAAALSVDYGYMLVVQRQLQNAADAGALSAADAFGSKTSELASGPDRGNNCGKRNSRR